MSTKDYSKPDDPSFWTVKEGGADLRVSTQIIRRAIRDNKLPAKKVGGQYRLKPADVRRFGDLELEDA